MTKLTKCPNCGRVMKMTMFSNNWLMKWFKCSSCGKEYKRGYTSAESSKFGLRANSWFPNLVELKLGGEGE